MSSRQKIIMSKQHITEAATEGVLWEKMFLKILQNSQENTCARVSFLIKLQALLWNFQEHFFNRTPRTIASDMFKIAFHIATKEHNILAHLLPMHSFSTPWKQQKTVGFLLFSGDEERVHWGERVHWEQMG